MLQFTELTQEEFDHLSLKHEQGSYLQTSAMAKLLEKRGWQTNYVGLKEQTTVLGGALIASKSIKFGRYFTIMGGPLLTYEDEAIASEFMTGLQQFVKQNQGIYVNISPKLVHHCCDAEGTVCGEIQEAVHKQLVNSGWQHKGLSSALMDENPRVVYVKDLTGINEQDLLKTYYNTAKRKIKKTSKYEVQFRKLLREELPKFAAIMEHTAKRQGFKDKGLAYYEALYDSFGQQAHFMAVELNVKAYIEKLLLQQKKLAEKIEKCQNNPDKSKQKANAEAEQVALAKRLSEVQKCTTSTEENQILAAGLFIETPQEMLFLFGGMYDQYKNLLSSSYFLQHQMLKETLAKGIKRFNFYGISGVYDGSDSVLNFKKGFQGIVEEQVGTYTFVVRPFKYKMYTTAKQFLNRLKALRK